MKKDSHTGFSGEALIKASLRIWAIGEEILFSTNNCSKTLDPSSFIPFPLRYTATATHSSNQWSTGLGFDGPTKKACLVVG
jgi:hypothetical protein